mmetsp:Transcript_11471/g.26208  ORF Transcript_11471/g.26208 Transcript_11471/m.26208 type:complete len:225 (+) Transcript_11471:1098-1772(+)
MRTRGGLSSCHRQRTTFRSSQALKPPSLSRGRRILQPISSRFASLALQASTTLDRQLRKLLSRSRRWRGFFLTSSTSSRSSPAPLVSLPTRFSAVASSTPLPPTSRFLSSPSSSPPPPPARSLCDGLLPSWGLGRPSSASSGPLSPSLATRAWRRSSSATRWRRRRRRRPSLASSRRRQSRSSSSQGISGASSRWAAPSSAASPPSLLSRRRECGEQLRGRCRV